MESRSLTIEVKLTRPASSKGGDRYEGDIPYEPKPYIIYLPQSISRINNIPIKQFTLTIQEKGE